MTDPKLEHDPSPDEDDAVEAPPSDEDFDEEPPKIEEIKPS